MIVSFATVDVQRVPALEDSAPLFEAVVRGEIPAFVVDTVDPFVELGDALEPVAALMKDHGLTLNPVGAEFLRTDAAEDHDIPLHVDGEQGQHVDLSLHRTLCGSAMASFFDTRSAGVSAAVVEGATRLFHEGRVDEELLSPKRYLAEIASGNLVVFRRGGPAPVAHIFETIEHPRYSNVERLHSAGLAA